MFLGSWNANKFWGWGGGFGGGLGVPHAPPGGRAGSEWYTSSFEHDPWPAKSYRPEPLAVEEKKYKKIKQGNSREQVQKLTPQFLLYIYWI